MSQTLTIIAIVGFSLAALLVLAAVIMFFALHIKQVRDDLTGKTAARSIAEIRSRAKTRKRSSTQAAKRYGWEKESLSTDALKAAAAGISTRAAGDTEPVDGESEYDEDEFLTTTLTVEDEEATTILVDSDEEATPTTNLSESAKKNSGKVPLAQTMQVFVVGLALVAASLPALAWAEENPLDEDITAPKITKIEWKQLEGKEGTLQETKPADPSVPTEAEYRLHTKQLRLEVTASDVDPGGETSEEVSGIDKVTISINNSSEIDFAYDEVEKKYYYDFDKAGIYSFKDIKIIVYDEQGNKKEYDLAAQENEGFLPDDYQDFRINPDDPHISVKVYDANNDQLGSYPYSAPVYTTSSKCTIRVEITDADMLYAKTQSSNTGLDQTKLNSWKTIVTAQPTGEAIKLGFNDFVQVENSSPARYYAEAIVSVEDRYSVNVTYSNLCNTEAEKTGDNLVFTIDRSDPYLTDATWSSGSVVSDILFTQKALLTLNVSDIKLDASNSPVTCGVSGVESVSIQYSDKEGKSYTLTAERTNEDIFSVLFEDDAQISLEKIDITINDNAGNSTEVKLADFYKSADQAPEYKEVVVGMTQPEAGFIYNNQDLKNGIYLNKKAEGTITISDQYFSYALEAYNQLSAEEKAAAGPILEVWYRSSEGDTPQPDTSLSKGILDFTATNDPNIWETDFTLEADGYYDLKLNYKNILGVPSNLRANSFSQAEICIDTVKPEFGAVQITPTEPLMWQRIFAPAGANLCFALSDSLSGIDPQELNFSVKGEVYPYTYDETTGNLSVDIPADDRRIQFSDVDVYIMDKAGNEQVLNLQTYETKNIDSKTTALIADSAAPVLSVSYDNNEAKNGHYYNAGRTATITIAEASFDIVKEEDPYRVVATKTANTSETSVYAKAFENPSGDGITWVTQVPCTTDGSYQLQASFTDPAGKSSQTFSDSFIVDTRAPLILISFDNNESENGGYFKAPRTATVRIYEDNFSESLASVTTQAADASGAAVGAPGATGWQQVKSGEWECTVYFGNELHYAMQVACTDLAGNVGEQAEEPEFVIDMTAPIVNVERVENYTAYADTIAPFVSFEDTNFEAFLCNIEITGASTEGFRYFENTETLAETKRTVDYSNFPVQLEYDDVYTLHATIKDLAGNAAEQTVVFSVNRYGSNYTFANQTKPHIGAYLKKAEDIVIIETNVSGLDSSSVRMAQNDRARALNEGSDFQLDASSSQTSWSQYTYTFPSELFDNDAYYRLMLSSQDVAGNYSENLMLGKNETRDGAFEVKFAVDGTSPVAALSNVAVNTAYYGPSQRLDVFMSDNMEADKAFLVVNGARVVEWSTEDLNVSRAFTYDLPASDDAYGIKLELRDKAGNITTTELNNIMVTSDWVRYVLNTPAILYPLIASIILTLGLAGIVIARFSLKNRNANKAA